eukprot:Clim_evm8s43 gene=Clim_evmTU8s43
MTFNVRGRVALITGGSRGLGGGLAERLASKGCNVILADVLEKEGRALAEKINRECNTKRAVFRFCDVTRDEHIIRALKAGPEEFGKGVSILVNNAGIGGVDSRLLYDPNQQNTHAGATAWALGKKVLEIDLTAVVNCTRLAVLEMIQAGTQKGAVIVNVASMGGLHPMGSDPIYAAAKHGVIGYSRSMDIVLGRLHGMRVNAICPSFTDTDMGREGIAAEQKINATKAAMLPVSLVVDGFIELIEDESMNGKVQRCTSAFGIDYVSYPEDRARQKKNKSSKL